MNDKVHPPFCSRNDHFDLFLKANVLYALLYINPLSSSTKLIKTLITLLYLITSKRECHFGMTQKITMWYSNLRRLHERFVTIKSLYDVGMSRQFIIRPWFVCFQRSQSLVWAFCGQAFICWSFRVPGCYVAFHNPFGIMSGWFLCAVTASALCLPTQFWYGIYISLFTTVRKKNTTSFLSYAGFYVSISKIIILYLH